MVMLVEMTIAPLQHKFDGVVLSTQPVVVAVVVGGAVGIIEGGAEDAAAAAEGIAVVGTAEGTFAGAVVD